MLLPIRSALLCLPLVAALPQDPVETPPQDPVEVEFPGFNEIRERVNAELFEQLEGAWVLRTYTTPNLGIQENSVHGFATFVDGYFALIMHGRNADPALIISPFFYRAILSQFELRDEYEMLAAALIGHSNFSGEFKRERVNWPRRYRITLSGNDLALTGREGSEIVFRRLQSGAFPAAAHAYLDRIREQEGEVPGAGAEGEGVAVEDATPEQLIELKNQQLKRNLQGAWVLRSHGLPGEQQEERDIHGFATFVDGYLTIVIHGVLRDEDDAVKPLFLQANLSQFELEGGDLLLASSLLGHDNVRGEFKVDEVNSPREYRVEIVGHDLTLHRRDGAALVFRRLLTGVFSEKAELYLDQLEVQGEITEY